MKLHFDDLREKWTVPGVGTYATKDEAMAAIRARKKTSMVGVKITDEQFERLSTIAAERKQSMSQVLRELIEKEVG